jgi:hypothetical protein
MVAGFEIGAAAELFGFGEITCCACCLLQPVSLERRRQLSELPRGFLEPARLDQSLDRPPLFRATSTSSSLSAYAFAPVKSSWSRNRSRVWRYGFRSAFSSSRPSTYATRTEGEALGRKSAVGGFGGLAPAAAAPETTAIPANSEGSSVEVSFMRQSDCSFHSGRHRQLGPAASQ